MSERKAVDLITTDEAAEILGIAPRTLRYRMIKDGLSRYIDPRDRRLRLLDRNEIESHMRVKVWKPRERVA